MQNTRVDNSGVGVGTDDFPIAITMMPANAGHHKIAFGGFVIAVVTLAIMTPFAAIRLPRVDAFIPVIQTVTCIADLLTAALLFAYYRVQPQRFLLALAAGFVSSGLFAFLQTLAFPRAYGPGAVIGDNLNSASWLFIFWHTVFPLAVVAYALVKDDGDDTHATRRSAGVSIGITIACAVAVTAALAWVATKGTGHLPVVYETETQRTKLSTIEGTYLSLVTALAIGLLFVRRQTILDQWLIVTLLAWVPTFLVAGTFSVSRFTLGWYIARVYALFAGSSLLFVLLAETMFLYTRLANAVARLRRSERHQRLLIAELDHRVKNTLAQVAGVAASTREGSRSIDDFLLSLGGRIQSMAAAHTLLSRTGWQSVDLNALVQTELAPYATGANVRITGTDVMLASAETQALAKVLHELATNAAKYGALSISGGQVSVSWESKPDGQTATLILEWREAGGPPVASKIRSSYGTALIRELIPHELGGTVDLVFATGGVRCRIEFLLEHELGATGPATPAAKS
jgi:two-component sensor histidine kinase